MNKKILKISGIFAIVLVVIFSCEKDPFPVSDVTLTPVYKVLEIDNITNANDDNEPFQITIYKDKPQIAEWVDKNKVKILEISNYSDNTVDSIYDIKYEIDRAISYKNKSGETIDTTGTHKYHYKVIGTLTLFDVTVEFQDTTLVTLYTMKISEDNVYQ